MGLASFCRMVVIRSFYNHKNYTFPFVFFFFSIINNYSFIITPTHKTEREARPPILNNPRHYFSFLYVFFYNQLVHTRVQNTMVGTIISTPYIYSYTRMAVQCDYLIRITFVHERYFYYFKDPPHWQLTFCTYHVNQVSSESSSLRGIVTFSTEGGGWAPVGHCMVFATPSSYWSWKLFFALLTNKKGNYN